jgi:hypothetical protein
VRAVHRGREHALRELGVVRVGANQATVAGDQPMGAGDRDPEARRGFGQGQADRRAHPSRSDDVPAITPRPAPAPSARGQFPDREPRALLRDGLEERPVRHHGGPGGSTVRRAGPLLEPAADFGRCGGQQVIGGTQFRYRPRKLALDDGAGVPVAGAGDSQSLVGGPERLAADSLPGMGFQRGAREPSGT